MKKDTISIEMVKLIETIGLIVIIVFFAGGYVNDKFKAATKHELAKIDELIAKK